MQLEFIIYFAVIALLATLFYADSKRLSIEMKHARIVELGLLGIIVLQMGISLQYGFFQVLLGGIIFLIIRKPLAYLMASFDREIVLLTLCAAAIPSIIALGFYFAFHAARASWLRRLHKKADLFPAMAHYAIAFALAVLLMLI